MISTGLLDFHSREKMVAVDRSLLIPTEPWSEVTLTLVRMESPWL